MKVNNKTEYMENKGERRTTLESESREYQGFNQSKVKKR